MNLQCDLNQIIKHGIADVQYICNRNYLGIDLGICSHERNIVKNIKENTIVHLHNVAAYLSIDFLIEIAKKAKIVITQQDMWYLTGRCSHAIGCVKWKTLCVNCENLGYLPSARVDNCKPNFIKKQEFINSKNVFLVTPSNWLKQSAEESFIQKNKKIYLIPNSIIKTDSCIIKQNKTLKIAMAASHLNRNIYKDFHSTKRVIAKLSELNIKCEVYLIGADKNIEKKGEINVISTGNIKNEEVIKILKECTIYLHLAHAETFGLAILEAMSVGLPVIASNIGGIPDLIKDYRRDGLELGNGILIDDNNDAEIIVNEINTMLDNKILYNILSNNSIRKSKEFSEEKMIENYVKLYEEIIQR